MRSTYEEFNLKIGRKIMQIRKKKALTREYLAELADISPKFLYEIEMGKKGCSSYILYRISSALDVLPDFLMCDNDEMMKGNIVNVYGSLDINQKRQVDSILQILYEIFYGF